MIGYVVYVIYRLQRGKSRKIYPLPSTRYMLNRWCSFARQGGVCQLVVLVVGIQTAELVQRRVHRNGRQGEVLFGIAAQMFHGAILHYFK